MTNPRVTLTVVWLVGLLAAVVVLEAYFARRTADGIPWLLMADRPAAYEGLKQIYGIVLPSILASWYLKPWPALRQHATLTFVARLAFVLTVAFHLLALYLLAQGHWVDGASLPELLDQAHRVIRTMSFLVVPVNVYYFGLKPS